jgi:hemerythrin-like domain-containing protein
MVPHGRRKLLKTLASASGLALVGCATTSSAKRDHSDDHDEAEVTPGEDLMQEHGVLERILLVYDEAIRRIRAQEPLDPALITRAAGVIRRFVEDYHEKNEERFVFPRLRAAQREIELVSVLALQHQRGRALTDEILRAASAGSLVPLAGLLERWNRMYRPHAAREDTVLFPAFRAVVGRSGYRELGEQFEDGEHALFGEHGFADVVAQVAELERALGIYDLSAFTPA